MHYEVTSEHRQSAKHAHELFIGNLIVLHIVLPVFLLKAGDIRYALMIPVISAIIILFIRQRANSLSLDDTKWYEMVHWKLASGRSKFLFIAYFISASIFLLGWMISQSATKATDAEIQMMIFTYLGIIPTFIIVLVTFVLESGALFHAGKGEVPDSMVEKFPPPAGWESIEAKAADAEAKTESQAKHQNEGSQA